MTLIFCYQVPMFLDLGVGISIMYTFISGLMMKLFKMLCIFAREPKSIGKDAIRPWLIRTMSKVLLITIGT
ncbi:hypothetical protein OIU77_004537 [Salix suchowensis]|uniref:Uncharacterized protein n=1 Tax=Salix suchowensis TaxID=1278906 RepID=A0ABQ9AUS4_9ROSI|nr:hypothetical protein OIU77_004537 [Salix suchowensis]